MAVIEICLLVPFNGMGSPYPVQWDVNLPDAGVTRVAKQDTLTDFTAQET